MRNEQSAIHHLAQQAIGWWRFTRPGFLDLYLCESVRGTASPVSVLVTVSAPSSGAVLHDIILSYPASGLAWVKNWLTGQHHLHSEQLQRGEWCAAGSNRRT